MFGRFKPVPFDPYGRRRRGPRVPRWLVLLLLGLAGGVAATLFVQERVLPPRLSADASERLSAGYAQADADRTRLTRQLEQATRLAQAASTDKTDLAAELESARASIERLRKDLASAVAALPPDPRGGSIEVRAGQFAARGNKLDYEVVLSRERAARPINAVLQLTLAGDGARGSETSVVLDPVAFSIGGHEVLRGQLALPDGLRPRQATVRVLDRAGGNALGMRVVLVK